MSKFFIGALIFAAAGLGGFALLASTPKATPAYTETLTLDAAFALPTSAKETPKLTKVAVKRIQADPEQVVLLDSVVHKNSVDGLIAALDQIRIDGYPEAYLLLDSPGGSVIDGGRLIDYMKTSKLKIVTVCTGICASMAAQIHQQGRVRLMQPKATLMFHQASGGVSGTLEQMDSQIGWIKRYVDRLDAEVTSRTKMSYADFKQRIQNELWIEGVDALALGFADGLAYVNSGSVQKIDGGMIPFLAPGGSESKPNTGARKHEFIS